MAVKYKVKKYPYHKHKKIYTRMYQCGYCYQYKKRKTLQGISDSWDGKRYHDFICDSCIEAYRDEDADRLYGYW